MHSLGLHAVQIELAFTSMSYVHPDKPMSKSNFTLICGCDSRVSDVVTFLVWNCSKTFQESERARAVCQAKAALVH